MEIYEAHGSNTDAGRQAVDKYLRSLPSSELEVYTRYYEQGAQQSLQAAQERYEVEYQVNPTLAKNNYQQTVSLTMGHESSEPLYVERSLQPAPLQPEERYEMAFQEAARSASSLEPESLCPVRYDSDGYYTELCQEPIIKEPQPQPDFSTSSCSTYTDRFGTQSTRCDGSLAHIYIHGAGRYTSTHAISNGYWGYNNLKSNRYFVAWDSTQSVQSQANTVRAALDVLCPYERNRPCIIYTHSAGGLMMGHVLANGNRWTLLGVNSIQAASGGSELANATLISPMLYIINSLGLLNAIGGLPIYSLSLPVPIARSMYNHDVTGGVPFTNFTSENERPSRSCKWYQLGCHSDNAWSSLVNSTLRNLYNGGSDWLVAYHSSMGFRSTNYRRANTSCNPDNPSSYNGYGTPFTSASNRNSYYWTNHTPFHWQPPGQSLSCRRGYTFVEHSAWKMLPLMP
jgi:hypothetical protein